MALQVWLPLMGDLHNQGLDPGYFPNPTTAWASNGKLSNKSIYSNAQQTATFNNLNNCTNFSIAWWVKIDAAVEIQAWYHIFDLSCIVGSTTATIRDEFTNEKGEHQIILGKDTTVGSTDYPYHDPNINKTQASNVWVHYAIVKNDINTFIYTNGVLTQTVINSDFENSSSPTRLTGELHLCHTTVTAGQLQDLRVYDNCLTPEEVKKIAQGLVLHYPLNHQGQGHENLIPCGSFYTYGSPWTTTKSETDGWAFIPNSAFEATPGETYTVSVQCDGNLYSSHGGTHNPADKHWTFWVYICNIDTTKNWQNGDYDSAICFTNNNYNYRKIGNTHVWTITLTNTQKYISLRTNSYSNGTDAVTINWWNIKVEKGDNFTSWSPSNLGRENLLCNTYNYANIFNGNTSTNTIITNESGGPYLRTIPTAVDWTNVNFNPCFSASLISGKTITVSFDVRGYDLPETSSNGWYWVTLNAVNSSTFNGTRVGNKDWSGPSSSLKQGSWIRLSYTIVVDFSNWAVEDGYSTNDFQYITLGLYNHSGKRIDFRKVKIEIGSTATQWRLNSSESGFYYMFEYDISGYNNNGIIIGNITWPADTPKYQVSTEFNGTEMIEAPWNPSGTSSFTIAGWFYHNSGTTYYAAKNTYNTYICLEEGRFFIYPAVGSAYVGYWTNTTNVWQHIVLVHDAIEAKLKLYVNGLFVDEVVTDGTVYNSDILDIGGRQGTAQYNGNISDFRIYATALSAEDIQALYQVKNIPD